MSPFIIVLMVIEMSCHNTTFYVPFSNLSALEPSRGEGATSQCSNNMCTYKISLDIKVKSRYRKKDIVVGIVDANLNTRVEKWGRYR